MRYRYVMQITKDVWKEVFGAHAHRTSSDEPVERDTSLY